MFRLVPVELCLVALLSPGLASAHGGVPVSEQIIVRGDQLLVPTKYWGVFFGTDGGPWRWICEEAINKDQARVWAFGGDGTFHVTDALNGGITSSRDGGCTWIRSTGEIATRSTSFVIADPVDPKRAWATSQAGTSAPWNALFTTVDDGLTWTPVLQADEYFRGVALSYDGKTLYVVGHDRATGPIVAWLHVSEDGGKTFVKHAVAYQLLSVTPARLLPLAVDPGDPGTVYLAAEVDPKSSLLQVTRYGTVVTEALALTGRVDGIGFDPAHHQVLVGTRQGDPSGQPRESPRAGQKGLFRSTRGGPFQPVGSLAAVHCITPKGNALYACAWNYDPDLKAIARSDDGGDTWKKVFQYADTVGPTESCPAATPVGSICPGVWQSYAGQLGITLGGTDAGVSPPPTRGCACDIVAHDPGNRFGPAGLLLLLMMGGGIALWVIRRRRRRRK